jgi:hypothetical protein
MMKGRQIKIYCLLDKGGQSPPCVINDFQGSGANVIPDFINVVYVPVHNKMIGRKSSAEAEQANVCEVKRPQRPRHRFTEQTYLVLVPARAEITEVTTLSSRLYVQSPPDVHSNYE